MRYYQFTFTLLAVIALGGCQSGSRNIPVSADSEMGRQIIEMDAKGRAFQNASGYSKALQDYEIAHGGSCTNIVFDHLQEPGQKTSRLVRFYTMKGDSPTCGKRTYYSRITFADAPHTVARRVEILLGPQEEASYREKALEFIRHAQAGDVDKMLELTSPLSHATQTDSMRSLYAKQVVPQFQGAVVTWSSVVTPNLDEQKNVGLIFNGILSGKKPISFDVLVCQENGKLVVVTIQGRHAQ